MAGKAGLTSRPEGFTNSDRDLSVTHVAGRPCETLSIQLQRLTIVLSSESRTIDAEQIS